MIKGVVFDKDGTLLDYEAFWVPAAESAISELLAKKGYSQELLAPLMDSIGAYDGINGILCYGTYGDAAVALNSALKSMGALRQELNSAEIAAAFKNNINSGKIIPTCNNIVAVLEALTARGIKIALVTSDNLVMAEKCLDALKIRKFFSAIFADDGINPVKPDPYYMERFCSEFNLLKHEVIMVGDTLTDMKFAFNSGTKAMAVAKSEGDRQALAPFADYVFDGISHILQVLEFEKQGT